MGRIATWAVIMQACTSLCACTVMIQLRMLCGQEFSRWGTAASQCNGGEDDGTDLSAALQRPAAPQCAGFWDVVHVHCGEGANQTTLAWSPDIPQHGTIYLVAECSVHQISPGVHRIIR